MTLYSRVRGGLFLSLLVNMIFFPLVALIFFKKGMEAFVYIEFSLSWVSFVCGVIFFGDE